MDKLNFLSLLQQNYDRISNFFGYDKATAIRIPLAVQYTFSRETFSGVAFEKNVEKIQKENAKQSFVELITTFSSTSTLSYKLAAYLVLHKTSQKEVERLIENGQYLVAAGFKKSPYQNIAAVFLNDAAHAKRAKKLHEEMRKHHYFLTGKDDIPYAVLLTKDLADAQVQAQTMRTYYDHLINQGFKGGDSLQAACQLLTLYNEQFQPEFVDYISAIKAALASKEILVKKRHYPYLAVLALTASTTAIVENIADMTKALSTLKMYQGDHVYPLMTAIHYVVHEMIEAEKLVQLTDISSLMQALDVSDFLLDFTFFFGLDILDLFT